MRAVFQSKPGMSNSEADKLLAQIRSKYPKAQSISYSHVSGETVIEIDRAAEELMQANKQDLMVMFSNEKVVRIEVSDAGT